MKLLMMFSWLFAKTVTYDATECVVMDAKNDAFYSDVKEKIEIVFRPTGVDIVSETLSYKLTGDFIDSTIFVGTTQDGYACKLVKTESAFYLEVDMCSSIYNYTIR